MALSRTQIQTAFQNSLGRPANTNEENSYFSVSSSGALTDAQVFQTISNSREADIISDPVVRFYQAAFGRVPDMMGFDNWQDYIRANGPTQATYITVATLFSQQPEFTNRFGTGTTVDTAYVQALYSTILGRTATAAEVDGYVSGAAGYSGRGGVLYAISQSQEAFNISNAAVNGFLDNAARGQAVYSGTLYTPANGAPNVPGGISVTLSPGVDTPTLGTSNDVITGVTGSAVPANNSYTLGDSIVDGSNTDSDVLNLTVIGTTQSPVVTVTNIETINLRNTGAGAHTFDATNVTGTKTINADVSTAGQTETISNISSLNTGVGLSGKGNLTANYTADLSGTNDTVRIAANNAGTSAATRSTIDVSNSNNVEAVTLAATGTNFLDLNAGTGTKTVTVTGSGAVTIGTLTTNATTLSYDASAATGAQQVQFGAGAVTVKGGSANDVFGFGTTFGTTDSVDGGAGTDTVAFEVANAVQVLPTISNVEVLAAKFSAAGIVNTANVTGLTTVNTEVVDGVAVNYTNLANTVTTLNFNTEPTANTGTTASGAVSIGYRAGSAAAVTLNIGEQNTTSATADSIDLGATTLSGVSTLTINSVRDADNTAAVTNTLASLDVGTATGLTLKTGSLAALNTGNLTGASLTSLTVNADGGAATIGTFAAPELTNLTLTSANKAALTTGALGTANSNTTASKLVNYSVTTGTETTVDLGNIDVATKSGASGLASSALKTIAFDLGSKATITNIGDIIGTDENGGNGNAGAGVSQLDSVSFKIGTDLAANADLDSVSARSITTASYDIGASTVARAVAEALNVDQSIGSISLKAGTNITNTLTLQGIDDNGATDLYNLDVGTITGSGAGNVAIAGLSTGVKSIAGIDLSGVTGTSEVAASTLSGTAGTTITIGSGGTTVTGVSGSNKADIITGGAGADVINGGDGADQITGGLGADTITGGLGQDVINLTEATSSIDTIKYAEAGSQNVDTVTGFKAGTDIVSLTIGNISNNGTTNTLSTVAGADVNGAVAAGAATVAAAAANATTVAADGTNLLFLSSTSATSFASAIGTGGFTNANADGQLGGTEGVAAVYYDANNGQAVFGYIQNTSTTVGNTLNAADTFVEVTRVGLAAADYTQANIANSLSFYA